MTERVAIDGTILLTRGVNTVRRVHIKSPWDGYGLLAEQVQHLKALETADQPFSVTFGPGYEISGTWASCTFDGDVILKPFRTITIVNYDFTLVLGN